MGEIKTMLDGLESWMKQRGFDSVELMKGLMSYKSVPDPAVYQRSQFMKYFSKVFRNVLNKKEKKKQKNKL